MPSKIQRRLAIRYVYADDLTFMAETEEVILGKLNKMKAGMEEEELRVNLRKAQIMRCQYRTGKAEKS